MKCANAASPQPRQSPLPKQYTDDKETSNPVVDAPVSDRIVRTGTKSTEVLDEHKYNLNAVSTLLGLNHTPYNIMLTVCQTVISLTILLENKYNEWKNQLNRFHSHREMVVKVQIVQLYRA